MTIQGHLWISGAPYCFVINLGSLVTDCIASQCNISDSSDGMFSSELPYIFYYYYYTYFISTIYLCMSINSNCLLASCSLLLFCMQLSKI